MGTPSMGMAVSLHRTSTAEPKDTGAKACGISGPGQNAGWMPGRRF